MLQSSQTPQGESSIHVIGAGIAGTWQALAFARAGYGVTLHERGDASMVQATSHWAGGMLAPWCERESTEPVVTRLGIRSLDLWRDVLPETAFNGSLVVAHPRDRADFDRFAKLTTDYERVDGDGVTKLEPSLDGRFKDALFFAAEGHVEPRTVLPKLHEKLAGAGARIEFRSDVAPDGIKSGIVIDCRGLFARDKFPDLRGVKGEMIVVETDDVELSRPVRVVHPRWPLYVIPRGNGRFMLGATSIESEDTRVSVRSALELLTAAYAVHPAFAEARIVEIGAGLRPALPDNLPRIAIDKNHIAVNGLYRHGFLLAPALAELTLNYVQRGLIDNEVMQCA
ncbi:MAG: FAD-dependent oxidoreductase [Rhizobiales bacterium]|nr:FAD-dependent oxidoreductase [Hyphomicrobiales bacterium]